MIPFNRPALTGREKVYIEDALEKGMFSGNATYNLKCCNLLRSQIRAARVQVVPSGTHALEMAALLLGIRDGDEIIMSSFGFSSTANAFALRGARIVFVDIRPDTMNLDESLLASAVSNRTRAIVPMHYAGVSCDMGKIVALAEQAGISVVEDSAQAFNSTYNGRSCGSMGSLGCLSFHETKNIHCGEGGALLINDGRLVSRAEVLQEKGTDRSRFFRGEIDRYTWVDLGSSWLVNEITAAFLFAQLQAAEDLTSRRVNRWQSYWEALQPLKMRGYIDLPTIPSECRHNGHIFYIKVRDAAEREKLIEHLKRNGVHAVFHYVPLHSSPAGKRMGVFCGEDRWTTRESERLLRLPLYADLKEEELHRVVSAVGGFYETKKW